MAIKEAIKWLCSLSFKILPNSFRLKLARLVINLFTLTSPSKQSIKFLCLIEDYVGSLLRIKVQKYISEVEANPNYKAFLTGYHNFFLDNTKDVQNVIDLGCGRGYIAHHLLNNKNITKVYGIDICEKNINFAKKFENERLEFILGDALSFNEFEKADCIVLSNFLEHVDLRVDFLRSFLKNKNLKKILIRVPIADRDWRVPLRRKLNLEWRLDLTHFHEYTLDSFYNEMQSAGFRVRFAKIQWSEIWACVEPAWKSL